MEKYNFNAGPCVLPRPAVESAIEAIRNFDNTGIGILEISHRTPGWERIMKETADLWKELLNIPDNYHVLFLGGGASTQFFDVPANLLKSKAAYLETGSWAKKAIKEAKFYGEVEVVASSADKNFSYIPKGYSIPEDVDYFHITSNNTIYGTEIHEDIDSPVTLVADMSSDIMSRPVDVSKYGIIYGGAQKNVGPAGVSFVIVREDILGKTGRPIQTMVDYRTHISDSEKNRSMFNTPPVFSIFVMHETLKWLKEQGGVEAIYKLNKEKAGMLYDEIDRNKLFVGTAAKEDRSIMNVCFVMKEEYKDKEAEFLKFATERGMVGIKGHRSVGGFRASIYNACPKEAVEALIKCMQDFEAQN
ncbi:MAG: 3-phosphoserine/phosphohydroxythreonine transaminase [Fermentimonas sp.]|jgi:phosphoserine aminotransferase|uniref:Phosphoserine aminotransferase n=1 Tax=Fermentimonas caenicola TaxID=1562970 RepID=A0A098BY43_9BACT|nr:MULTISPECIES: 3-phosphoserine/phosphohydroxythreonine transaminase [Lascolabacillus]MBP6196385.1 3-phosphoserine/phosphohydroxythreonine transaminase [Fermentimonas sp.]MDI9626746.1 3-phosphoserine/phosphohydroxythreonine transaminase [Bacteroidota bacterium]TAH60743.1 MAG: 3-phosphoserine/phosphohydroxythreonine transaminase [Fermentimonas caenicola]MBP7104629.1 3-phosphoserine/phosphohydroxythreonine transaminase [Fermentimonas sp.]MDD2607554.1 3-phosphoserine/phosphohydroxythreonine tran